MSENGLTRFSTDEAINALCTVTQKGSDFERNLVQMFKLLADETRLRILYLLAREGEKHVNAMCDRIGMSQPALSHHLALLRLAGLVEARRDGKHNFYSVRQQFFSRIVEEIVAHVDDAPNIAIERSAPQNVSRTVSVGRPRTLQEGRQAPSVHASPASSNTSSVPSSTPSHLSTPPQTTRAPKKETSSTRELTSNKKESTSAPDLDGQAKTLIDRITAVVPGTHVDKWKQKIDPSYIGYLKTMLNHEPADKLFALQIRRLEEDWGISLG